MFHTEQAVNTPRGKAYVVEHYGSWVCVELLNGVEMDFLENQVQDWTEFQKVKLKLKPKFKLEHKSKPKSNAKERLIAHMIWADTLLSNIFKDNPEGRRIFEKAAGDRLLEHCRTIIEAYKREYGEPKGPKGPKGPKE